MDASITIEGLEDVVERIVEEKVSAVLAEQAVDEWLTSDQAATYLGIDYSTYLRRTMEQASLALHAPRVIEEAERITAESAADHVAFRVRVLLAKASERPAMTGQAR